MGKGRTRDGKTLSLGHLSHQGFLPTEEWQLRDPSLEVGRVSREIGAAPGQPTSFSWSLGPLLMPSGGGWGWGGFFTSREWERVHTQVCLKLHLYGSSESQLQAKH